MNPEETKRFTEGLFLTIRNATDYCKDLQDKFDAILNKNSREITIYGIFLRVVCLMKTLCKCNERSDCQTILHANRALIEMATDLILLLHDETDEVDKKIRAWEQSAKLKAAEEAVKYFTDKKLLVPDKCKHQQNFVNTHQAQIRSQRQRFWGQTKHPSRWTNKSLEHDVKATDNLEGTDLEELYQLEYRRMNWFAHGSGLAGSRELDADCFFNLCGLAYDSCTKLAMLCSKVTLKAFGYFDRAGVYVARWEEVSRNIQMIIAPFLPR